MSFLVISLCVSHPPCALAADIDQKLLLEVVINGHATGQVSDFVERGTTLYATRHDLHELGFSTLGVKTVGKDSDLVSLKQLTGVVYQLESATQTLNLTMKDAALLPTALAVQEGRKQTPVLSGTGAVMNYAVTDTFASGQNIVRGQIEGRVFTPYGIVDTQYLVAAGAAVASGTSNAVRLDSSYSYSDPDEVRRYRAGDLINTGLIWSRPIRIGGIQVGTNFGLRPDLITFPTPQISGTAAVPSTVDVLVNNVHQLTRSVDSGPFTVTQLPVVNGAGSVSVVLQDALGQQTTQTLPFYTSTSLLTPGLASYSVELGKIRLNYGAKSNDYRASVASGTARYGVLQYLTVEGHSEATTHVAMGGAGFAVNVADLAIVSLAASGSSAARHAGTQFSASIERSTPILSLTASIQHASPNYRDVAAVSGDPVPRQLIRAGIGISTGRYGMLSVAYTSINQQPSTETQATNFLNSENFGFGSGALTASSQAPRTDLLTATQTARLFGNVYGYATGYHDFAKGGSSGFMFGISMSLGTRSSVSASVGSYDGQANGTVQATRAALVPGDYGGTLLNENGSLTRQMALGSYISQYGQVEGGFDRIGGQTAVRASAAGSLVLADGTVFAANPIVDSFAVVDTGGVPNVGVLQENRPFGQTNGSGQLLVPNLQSFADNRIDVDPATVPIDADLATPSAIVRPQDRSGVVVRFPVQSNASATMHLVDKANVPIAVGSLIVQQSNAVRSVVGYDGMAYLRGLVAHNIINVTAPNGKRCKAEFDFVRHAGVMLDLGRLQCQAEAP